MERLQLTKYVYFFDEGRAAASDGDPNAMRNLLGGKGAGLAEMTAAGLPVPSGFTITTQACLAFYKDGRTFPDGLDRQIADGMRDLERRSGKTFGSAENPLLVSVRSGARVSMPGMMDTILNLGLNDETVAGLARLTSNERFAWDAYRRFIMMFSSVVLGVSKHRFEELIDAARTTLGVRTMRRLTPQRGERWSIALKPSSVNAVKSFPRGARAAHRGDTRGLRFLALKTRHRLPALQQNLRRLGHGSQRDGDGVRQYGLRFGNRRCVHRNPNTGERALFGEYLSNAQGEDSSPVSERRKRSPTWRVVSRRSIKIRADRDATRTSLPRRAGPRVYRRARQAVHVANAQCETNR